MQEFKEWIINEEGCEGYAFADIALRMCDLLEAKKDTKQKSLWHIDPNIDKLPEPDERQVKGTIETPKFDPEAAKSMAPFNDPDVGDSCPVTPLSGYAKHIRYIQSFAKKNPENFAQVMMFSPLSANVPFPKHWDNFYVLMLLLKHYHPHEVTPEQLKDLVKVFDDKHHSLGHTISGWKLKTISHIWSEKEKLFQELQQLAVKGTDREIITRLCQFTGVQPVKAGFMAQLLFGRAGCIDTHNIDIYSTVYPELGHELGYSKDTLDREKTNKQWNVDRSQIKQGVIPKGVDAYVGTLEKLKARNVGTEQLWNVWVDFVENFYRYISEHGRGAYTPMGSAIDMDDPLYRFLSKFKISKTLPVGRKGVGDDRTIQIPLLTGRGEGASATHLMVDPDEMAKQHIGMYRRGEPGGAAASSVPYSTLVTPSGEREPLEKSIGMAMEPSSLHYFARPGDREIDPEYLRHVVKTRMQHGSHKDRAEADRAEREKKLISRVPGLPGFEDVPPPKKRYRR